MSQGQPNFALNPPLDHRCAAGGDGAGHTVQRLHRQTYCLAPNESADFYESNIFVKKRSDDLV